MRWRCCSDSQRPRRRAVRTSQRHRSRGRGAARRTRRASRLSPARIRPAGPRPHAGLLRSARRRPVAGRARRAGRLARACRRPRGAARRLGHRAARPLRLLLGCAARDALRRSPIPARVASLALVSPAPAARRERAEFEQNLARRNATPELLAERAALQASGLRSSDLAGIQPAPLRARRVRATSTIRARAHELTPFRITGRTQQAVWDSLGRRFRSAPGARAPATCRPSWCTATTIRFRCRRAAATAEALRAPLVVLPQCGHVPYVEAPEAFVAALDPFLPRDMNATSRPPIRSISSSAAFRAERFPAIRAALGERSRPRRLPARRAGAGADARAAARRGPRRGGRRFVALVHAAYLFWRDGERTEQPRRTRNTRALCAPLGELPACRPMPAEHRSPERTQLHSGRAATDLGPLAEDAPFEPLDGWFAAADRGADCGWWPASACTRSGRASRSSRSHGAAARARGPRRTERRFSRRRCPAATLAGLHAISAPEELLLLGWRATRARRCPDGR